MTSNERVVIVGGGAAGIGAARVLAGAGHRPLLLEANDRLGGRAFTIDAGGLPLDLGCGYLHSADRNPWVAIAEAQGATIDRSEPSWRRQYRNLGFPPDEQQAAAAEVEAFHDRLHHLASDRASDAFAPGNRWNPYLQALSGYLSGDSFEQVSTRDYLAYDEASTDANWRLPQGYGALVASTCPAGVEVRLNTRVTTIDHGGHRPKLETSAGTVEAAAVIVTVPTTTLATERLRFRPALPAKAEAAAGLPLGLADKLFLALDGPEALDPDVHLIGDSRSANSGSYQIRPLGRPIIEGFYGGDIARVLEATDEAGMAAHAIDELAALLGNDIRQKLRPIARSRWGRWAGGSYSHALPGRADARAALREPVDGRLFFAGEACSAADFSTAHGALATGEEAARALLAQWTEATVRG
jgi:monoamine oxidase